MKNSFADLRQEYVRERLLKSNARPDPVDQFRIWLDEAVAAGVYEPNAMTLATATLDGRPSARTVLLKGFDEAGFCFYTNYASRKGREMAENPWAALTFWWGPLTRQVRIEGLVEKLTPAESDAYFASRPLGSRLGALVSEQSRVIPGRATLERRLAELEIQYAEDAPPRPDDWGGYRLKPTAFEFWQGAPHRLHDRLHYTCRADGGWVIQRLAP